MMICEVILILDYQRRVLLAPETPARNAFDHFSTIAATINMV